MGTECCNAYESCDNAIFTCPDQSNMSNVENWGSFPTTQVTVKPKTPDDWIDPNSHFENTKIVSESEPFEISKYKKVQPPGDYTSSNLFVLYDNQFIPYDPFTHSLNSFHVWELIEKDVSLNEFPPYHFISTT